jgi:hypothetical protein
MHAEFDFINPVNLHLLSQTTDLKPTPAHVFEIKQKDFKTYGIGNPPSMLPNTPNKQTLSDFEKTFEEEKLTTDYQQDDNLPPYFVEYDFDKSQLQITLGKGWSVSSYRDVCSQLANKQPEYPEEIFRNTCKEYMENISSAAQGSGVWDEEYLQKGITTLTIPAPPGTDPAQIYISEQFPVHIKQFAEAFASEAKYQEPRPPAVKVAIESTNTCIPIGVVLLGTLLLTVYTVAKIQEKQEKY